MKVKCVAHLAYYMFTAVGVAAEVKGDDMVLRLNALEETVITLLGAVTTLREDNNALREQSILDNDANEEAISSLKGEFKEDNKVLRNELNFIRSRRTTSTTGLDKCLKVVGKGKKLVIKCKTDFTKPALFKKPVKITDDVRVIKGNLMITNGGNSVDELNGEGPDLNGKGNLVIGATEVTQAGVHNIVIGTSHTFSSYGGLVLGQNNTISGPHSAVTGGYLNTASGLFSAVSGGEDNEASGGVSVVIGGHHNTASGGFSFVSGGWMNTASGTSSLVSGGEGNEAYGQESVVSGGYKNVASGNGSVVSGGYGNEASITSSVVSGGRSNEANGSYSTVIGGKNNIATNDYSVV